MEPEINRIEPEIPLPESIAQHIQSFLSAKEAAQTTVLSKSWYTAWLTRPILDFDQCNFGCRPGIRGDEEGFWEFVQKTMQRYEELNLKIESFRLLMRGEYIENGVEPNNHSRAKELIVKAMKMGAVDLYFEPLYECDLIVLPNEVLGSETLTRLSLVGCKISRGGDRNVRCSRLKSLRLQEVCFEGDVMWDIISSCPLIEELSLMRCRFLTESQNSSLIELSPYSDFGKQDVGSNGLGQVKLFVFDKLKCLSLGKVCIHPSIFQDFSSRFPCLKELTFSNCSGFNRNVITISSRSLECITFSEDRILKANLDVPSIRKFKYQGHCSPDLQLEASSTDWESDISIICYRLNTLWVLQLKKLLTILSASRISLSLILWTALKHTIIDFQGLPKIEMESLAVESLTIKAEFSVCYTLLECLFQNSRPKFVTLHVPSLKDRDGSKVLGEVLRKVLPQGDKIRSTHYQKIFAQVEGQEELSVKFFEEVLAGWQPLALSSSLDASTGPGNEQTIHYQLTW